MSTTTRELPITVLPPIDGSTVKEGTAVVEPEFIGLRKTPQGYVKFVTANSWKDYHKALLQAEELEEQVVEIDFLMEGYPLDCIVQLNRAIWEIYGFSHARDRMTFFGPIPPKRLNIKTGINTSVQVVYGEMAPPAWEDGSLTMNVTKQNPLSLQITGQIKRKFETKVKEIVTLAEKLLKEQSIYRGNAVELDLNYIMKMDKDPKFIFDPSHCAPKFIDTTQPITLILSKDIQFEIETNIWGIMANPENFRVNGVPIKCGVQLDGGNGTGKTMTAYKTAQLAMDYKWTYTYLRTPLTAKTFLTGYRVAQLYGPSIYFVEDNDVLFGKDRDEEMNSLLETLDGITAKNAEVITIFTTNYPERLNKAFLRSGRVNHSIHFRAPDADAAGRFVKTMTEDFLSEDVDIGAVGTAFQNLVPADIQNGIDQAKKFCIGKHGRDIQGKITTDMLITAAEVVRRKSDGGKGEETPEKRALRRVKSGMKELFTLAQDGV